MSVSKNSNKLLSIIFNQTCRSLSNTTASYINPRYLTKSSITNYSRNIHTSKNVAAIVSYKLTDIGEGIREVAVKEWFVKVGDKVSQFDNICEVQSDKASVTITSRYDGTISKLHYNIDDVALVGQPLVDIETENENNSESSVKSTPVQEIAFDKLEASVPTSDNTQLIDYRKTLCIPSVRRLAKEHNVNLIEVTGTGKGGRVLKEDILKFLQLIEPQGKQDVIEVKDVEGVPKDKIEPIRSFKKAMLKTMTEALKIPHFVYCDEIAVTNLSKIRQSVKKQTEEQGIKLTLMPFFIKAASNALARYPILNSSLDDKCENILYKGSHNIGVAMDTAMGLAVPVIKNVEKLCVVQVAKELNRLMKSGKEGNFTPNDLAGGTFTISNIGVIGGTYTSPVILPPQVAIIALGTTQVLARFDSSNAVIAEEIINISGSADHRVVDGATMANFIALFKKQVENPYLLFLNL